MRGLILFGLLICCRGSVAADGPTALNAVSRTLVKVSVSGTLEDGTKIKDLGGSGFIVVSGRETVVATAAHVISPGSIKPLGLWMKDPGGRLQRRITIEWIDLDNQLKSISKEVSVLFEDSKDDFALLAFDGGGYPVAQIGQLEEDLPVNARGYI